MVDKDDERSENDLKDNYLIYSGISNDQLQLIKDKERAHEIIKKFGKMYVKK